MGRWLSDKNKALRRVFKARGSWRKRLVILCVLSLTVSIGLFTLDKVTVKALPCPCNMFTTPTGQTEYSDGDYELGFKFKADVDGYITGVRFYKQGSMGGTHTGNLWTTGGSKLATATFTGETSSGWQSVSFGSPVAVTAGTTYVASVSMNDNHYIATASYFNSEVTNYPLRVPSSGSSGGNGIYNTTPGSFPTTNGNGGNYWIDVTYVGNTGSTAPTVSSTDPVSGATGVKPGDTVSAVFDESMNHDTISTSTFIVKDSVGDPVSGAVSYSDSTKTASFVADEGFDAGETYTATIKGGSGAVAKNMEGIALDADYSWPFTISSTNECPCSLEDLVNPAGAVTSDDSGGLELGVKVKPSTNGYISSIRFYKTIIDTQTTHDVHVWNSSGTSLASATSSNETDYGWQTVKLGTPLQVSAGQLYIISYSNTTAQYVASVGGLSGNITDGYLTAYADGSSENSATDSGNHNGAYATTAGNYPDIGSATGNYYWVDAVFSTTSTVSDPLNVKVTQPSAGSYGVEQNKLIKATFDHALNGSTVNSSTVQVVDSNNDPVSGTVSYESSSHSVVFTPDSSLAYNEKYTVRLSGSIEDTGGTALGSQYSWSFTVGKALATDVNQGPGGPVLLITSTGDKYSYYYAEILRTEGFNYFAVKDIGSVSAATLSNYAAVVLSEMSLTQGQADMFTNWVTGSGGNLVAMRPDKKLAGLLGLTDDSSTRSNQYMLVDTAGAPGKGIVGQTIQFKGTADNYTANGATSVATFYSDASTATSNPAVTIRSVGSHGGTAAAFSYDLAKSVIGLHQGNQAWAGQERDGVTPIRSDDLYYGAKSGDVQPDWVDLDKVDIPQADEQQRLLANILTEATRDRRPLPRFWYLPYNQKAAMVLAGDDHDEDNDVGTEKIFNNWLNESPTWCAVDKWECVRASDYNYVGSALTDARALQFYNLGFGINDHPQNGCTNFTSYSNLNSTISGSLSTWRAKYVDIPDQQTDRFHCYVWSDWDSMAKVDYANGIRYDLNYTTYPSSWIGTRAAIITGSGMNMRFTDASGSMIDVYQGATNFENSVSGSAAINTVLSNATGAAGYYGMFGTHYDMNDSFDRTLFNAAEANDVPIISADQALAWLDGRNSSEFSSFDGGNGRYTFDIQAGMGAEGLDAMMPIHDAGGTLTSLTRGTGSVSYQTETVKGVEYAVFNADPGSYTATYSDYSGNSGGGNNNGPASSSSVSASGSFFGTLFNNGAPSGRQPVGNSGYAGPAGQGDGDHNGAGSGQKTANPSWVGLGSLAAAVAGLALLVLLWLKIRRPTPPA